MLKRIVLSFAVIAIVVVCSTSLSAAIIVDSEGNTAPGFVDGSTPSALNVIAAQAGQPAPFESGHGGDVFANFDEDWTHTYAAIVDTILSATWTVGLLGHESAVGGDQVQSFTIDTTSFAPELNVEFNAHGGGSVREYNVYSLILPGSLFPDLADGSTTMDLVLQNSAFGPFNGANLIFSTLTIETGTAPPIPEPSSLALFGLGGLTLLGYGWRRKRKTELSA